MQTAAAEYNLKPATVDLWLEQLSSSQLQHSIMHTPLSDDEIKKANAFYFEHDRMRYASSHKFLRLILSRYLQQPPEQIIFTKGDKGKPFISPIQNNIQLEFNIAHSGDFLAIAISQHNPVGVDVEVIASKNDLDSLAKHCFSAMESEEYLALENNLRSLAFFRGWARKEAYIKALGTGLSKPLGSFSVNLWSEKLPQSIDETDPHMIKDQWQLWPIFMLEPYHCTAALVTDIAVKKINYCSISLNIHN